MKIGTGLLDKMVNGAFLNKRRMGRPVKYNIRTRGNHVKWIELIFSPRNAAEKRVGDFIRFCSPYLAFVTYRFHVEKAREIGIRIEDFYVNKFHKEAYFMHHVYAQNFHPTALLERVRDVQMYRRPRTIFKGFKVPDWAQADKVHGWDLDIHSREAWNEALHEFHSESTPAPFFGEREGPNPLQWFRLEQYGKGMSSRLFFNEIPQPWWHRHQGHLDEDKKDELLFSFTHGDQVQPIDFGIDTTTEEGRIAYEEQFMAMTRMTPELLKPEDIVYPHEMGQEIPNEPHFKRVWQSYRDFTLLDSFQNAVKADKITGEEADAALKFLGLGKRMNMSMTSFILANRGLRPDLANDEGYLAAEKAFAASGIKIDLTQTTAMSFDDQFWYSYDEQQGLTEIEMREMIPQIMKNPSNRAQIEAIFAEKSAENQALDESRNQQELLGAQNEEAAIPELKA